MQLGISASTQQWQAESAKLSPFLNRKGSNQCQNIAARNKETWTGLWSAAWPPAWWQLRHGYTLQGNNQQESFRGSARTMKTCVGSELSTREERTNFNTSSLVAQKNSQEQMNRGIPCVPLILALGVRPFWVWGSVFRGRSHYSTHC